jgi:hypothetical protein
MEPKVDPGGFSVADLSRSGFFKAYGRRGAIFFPPPKASRHSPEASRNVVVWV